MSRPGPSGSSIPLNPSDGSTPEGSLSCHTLPSPPLLPALVPPSASRRQPRLEVRILPRTAKMDIVEEQLRKSLVAFIGGSRLVASPAQVALHLLHHFEVSADEVQVHLYRTGFFLLCFHDGAMADQIYHVPWPPSTDLTLIFNCYTRQTGALFSPLRFNALISIENLPAHTWLISIAQEVLGSSTLIFDVPPASAMTSDLSKFLVAAWSRHPDLIPNEVGSIVLEPVVPFVEHAPLFIWSSELIHSKCDKLQFCVFIQVLEVHDYTILDDSDDDPSGSSDDSGGDGLPIPLASSSLCPWPCIYRVADDWVSPSGEAWPSLPNHGGGIAWSMSLPAEACSSYRSVHSPKSQPKAAPRGQSRPMKSEHGQHVLSGSCGT
jgi:hypothetical protein